MDEDECLAEFKFRKQDILILSDILRISQRFICEQRSICDGLTQLCMLLKRLSYPCRMGDIISRFARPVAVINMITNTVINYIYSQHGHRITTWNHVLVNLEKLQIYANAIYASISH